MTTLKKSIELVGESEMENFGRLLAKVTGGQGVLYLEGRLGAGKTTISRGILRGLGHKGPVKSPTFTLVEPYILTENQAVYHFDLYRLGDPEELDFMGIKEYFNEHSLCLIEWPERGAGWLPSPDICIEIDYFPDKRHVTIVSMGSTHGDEIIGRLSLCSNC